MLFEPVSRGAIPVSYTHLDVYKRQTIDGANRWRQTLHVTLPGIAPTIIIMLLLRMGSVMNVGYEKIILLYNEGIYETADVISTFVYRKGLEQAQWSYSAAVGLFNSVVNFVIIVLMNRFSRAITDVSPVSYTHLDVYKRQGLVPSCS